MLGSGRLKRRETCTKQDKKVDQVGSVSASRTRAQTKLGYHTGVSISRSVSAPHSSRSIWYTPCCSLHLSPSCSPLLPLSHYSQLFHVPAFPTFPPPPLLLLASLLGCATTTSTVHSSLSRFYARLLFCLPRALKLEAVVDLATSFTTPVYGMILVSRYGIRTSVCVCVRVCLCL